MNTEFEIARSHISVTKVTAKITGNSDITLRIKMNDIKVFFFKFIIFFFIYKVKINNSC
jgi:hypothetical protein